MVLLVNNNSSRSSDEEDNHTSTMSDESIEILDDELPMSNGTENETPTKEEQPSDEKMEVIDLDDIPSPASPSAESDKNSKESNEKSGSVKSRSSRSASINSSTSMNVDHSNNTTEEKEEGKEEEKEKKVTSEEEEDFLGFDSDSETMSKVESCIDQYKKVANMNSSINTPNESTIESIKEKPTPNKEQSSSTESKPAEVAEPGNVTPSTSVTKKVPRSSKKSMGVDLSNPEFRKPFEFGWVRELVYRSTTDNTLRRNADIYYYTPAGKKVRSSREILEHLTGDLTIENFTFFKEAIGLDDPSKEIIREAKGKPGPRVLEDMSSPPVKKTTPKVTKTPSTPAPKYSTPKDIKVITPKVVFRGNTTPKIRPSAGKSKLDKKRKSAGPDDVDVMVESEDWSPEPPKVNSNGIKRPLDDSSDEKDSSPPEKMGRLENKENDEKEEETDNTKENKENSRKKTSTVAKSPSTSTPSKTSPQYFMMNLNAGFVTLLHAFRYLRVYELLRAAHVCKMWQFVASHAELWETVKMKNSRVSDWEGFGNTLAARGTKNLDLRKMLVPDTYEAQVKMWEELCKNIKKVTSLVSVDLGRCTPAAFVAMAEAAPQLESLVSTAIKGNEIDLAVLENNKQLTELKLKTVTGSIEIKDLSFLDKLSNLTTLALTTVKSLKGIENHLPPTLVSLELGECCSLTKEVATVALPKLLKLRRLRLEKGQGECPTIALLEAVSSLPRLRQLELINFDIKPGFDKALAKCTNLRILLVIPTYVTQSATTNHVVMGGVAKLSQTLSYFIWGLTLELLKVTDLFIGQVENQKAGKSGPILPKKGTGDSIPILKPSTSEGDLKDGSAQAPSQVDILALPNLQRVLSTLLPTTRIKILKVPFSATWRQVVTDGYI